MGAWVTLSSNTPRGCCAASSMRECSDSRWRSLDNPVPGVCEAGLRCRQPSLLIDTIVGLSGSILRVQYRGRLCLSMLVIPSRTTSALMGWALE